MVIELPSPLVVPTSVWRQNGMTEASVLANGGSSNPAHNWHAGKLRQSISTQLLKYEPTVGMSVAPPKGGFCCNPGARKVFSAIIVCHDHLLTALVIRCIGHSWSFELAALCDANLQQELATAGFRLTRIPFPAKATRSARAV